MREADIRPADLFNQYLELCREDAARFFADTSQFMQVPCPACGAERSEFGLEKSGFRYDVCADCGSLYANPRPRPAAIADYYQNSAAVAFWSTHFFRQTAEARRVRMFRPRAHLVAEWADRLGLSAEARFADIGAGYGIFLEEVAALGRFATVTGVEPAPNLAAICRDKGFAIIEAPAEAIPPGAIDAGFATCFEVLEHVHDPLGFLTGVARALAPGAVLMATTLTVTGFDIQVLWQHSKSVQPPQHINLMSVDGLARLAERAGLSVLDLSTPGELDVDIVRNMLNESPDLPVDRFVRALALNASDAARRDFQALLKTHRLSSHLRMILRKPG